MDILVQTKLILPPKQTDLVARQLLIDRLNASTDCRLLLFSAPAGFGKSTLAASWAHQLQRNVAWLALDELDDEPLRFWRYVTAALATAEPSIQAKSEQWFQEAGAALSRSLPTLLVNTLSTLPHELTLILDDYHFIQDQTIHNGVDFLLDYLPTHVQLVLLSRQDPPLALPRLRARNQLCEIRTDDLRFGPEESNKFLRERMGLALDESATKLLTERTEGWVAGLQFSGLSLQSLADAEARIRFISELSGRDRHIVDYLMTEVFAQQSPDLQQFLLQTAILDRLSALLCNALLDRTDSQQVLDQLERANLFVVPLDNERYWYRYHHLFSELLQTRLRQTVSATQQAALHMRAHDWYVAAGMVDHAVDHALLAGQPQDAATLLLPQVYRNGQWNDGAFLHTRRWIDQLPDALLREHPRLAHAALEANLLTYRAERVEHYLALLESIPDLPDDVTALVMGIQANFLRIQAKNDEARALLRKAMAIAPEENLYAQLSVKMQMAVLICEAETIAEGVALLNEVVSLSDVIGHRHIGLLASGFLVLLTIGQGNYHLAQQHIERTLAKRKTEEAASDAMAGLLYIGLSILHYEWNDLDQAEEFCDRGLVQSEVAELGDMLWHGYQIKAYLAVQRHDLTQLTQLMAKAEQLLDRINLPPIIDNLQRFYDTFMADIALRLGDWEQVAQWVQRYPSQIEDPDLFKLYHHEQIVRVVLAQAEQPHAPALAGLPTVAALPPLLEQLLMQVEARGMGRAVVNVHNLLARTYWLLDETEQAFHHLHRALTVAQPEGAIRSFLDEGQAMYHLLKAYGHSVDTPGSTTATANLHPYLTQILAAFAAETAPAVSPTATPHFTVPDDTHTADDANSSLIEPLTDRELEVLQEIINGLTNQEIADRLVISIGTVKRHISNIYGKLDVRHRTAAVARAQELELVD